LPYLVAKALSAVNTVVPTSAAAITATIAIYLVFMLVEEKQIVFIWIRQIGALP
jgi:hypothetical protein